MNYSSFCDAMFASLADHMEPGVTLSRDMIQKNNGVMLDALIVHIPESAGAPVIYLNSLYCHYESGSSLDEICNMVLAGLQKDCMISPEAVMELQDLQYARDKISFRIVSRKANRALLKTIPWVPFLDLAVIFYLHLGNKAGNQITSVITNRHIDSWHLSTAELFSIAKINTPKLCPSAITRLDHLIFGWDTEPDDILLYDDDLPCIYVLTNQNGINGASCLLYDDIIKDFADRIDSDLIILPSSIHEVLLVPDIQMHSYEDFREMVQSINASDVPKEDFLSDEIYLYRRKNNAGIMKWNASSHTADTNGTENP